MNSFAVPGDLSAIVTTAIREDVGNGDLTASLIPKESWGRARVICRDKAVVCGIPYFNEVFLQMDPRVSISWRFNDGDSVAEDEYICSLDGPMQVLLTGERTALNFVQMLSGTATVVHEYASLIEDYPCKILDTRKTIPGLRSAQKYAVICGGGANHRMGLYDAILVKENHIMAAGSIQRAVEIAMRDHPKVDVIVEVEDLEEFSQARDAGVKRVLLDNFSLEMMQEAVDSSRSDADIVLEASGGICKENIVEIAKTGVDFVSIGALTKHIRAIDLSLRFDQ